jgi:hypothetical protein
MPHDTDSPPSRTGSADFGSQHDENAKFLIAVLLRSGARERFFYPRDLERFLENLDFHGLAAEQAHQLAHPSFQLTDTARATRLGTMALVTAPFAPRD